MEWIINNWFLLLILAVCLGMHFMGGHGSHGKHEDDENDAGKAHAHTGPQDGGGVKKGHGSCH